MPRFLIRVTTTCTMDCRDEAEALSFADNWGEMDGCVTTVEVLDLESIPHCEE